LDVVEEWEWEWEWEEPEHFGGVDALQKGIAMAPRRGNERKETGKTPSDGLQEALLRDDDQSEDVAQHMDQFLLAQQQGSSLAFLDPEGAPGQTTSSRDQLEGYCPPQISMMSGNDSSADSLTHHPFPTQPFSTGSLSILDILERVPKNGQGLVPICGAAPSPLFSFCLQILPCWPPEPQRAVSSAHKFE